jgi:spermidine synthase
MPTPADRISESSMTDLWNVWFTELHRRRAGLTIKIKQLLYTGKSPYQRIDVLDTYEFGRMLVLYGSIMVTEKDEFVYHEMLAHVPLFAHPKPRKVLIIGGGDGGTLREVMRHKQVRATMVEIDEAVVQTSQKYLPTIGTAFKNPRAQVLFEDGERWLARCQEKFDVILVDASDPVGPAEVLFQKPFHRQVARCLAPGGIFVTQSESPFFHQKTVAGIQRNLQEIFKVVRPYTAAIPTYPSGFWSFTLCSDTTDPVARFKEGRVKAAGFKLKYYNAGIHRACFALPSFMLEDGADLGL